MLKCEMIHSFPNEYFKLFDMFKNGGVIREWTNEVINISNSFDDPNLSNKIKGDMFEVFSEIFFNQFASDEAVGIRDYTPISIGDDFGVDATGINVVGNNCVIQVKFRSNPLDLIEYSDIAKTYTSAILQLNIEDVYNFNNTVYLFTNANGVTAAFSKVMHNKVVIINRSIIQTKVDNNLNFWKRAYDLIFETLDG